MSVFIKYTPVAADLRAGDALAAIRSVKPIEDCLSEIGAFLGAKHLFPVSSGRAALYAILKASISPGSEVILPGYTCYTVAAAVVRAGMIPILSDNDPSDLGYNLNELQQTIREHPDTKAIIVCHLFGIALDIEEIKNIVGPDVMIIDDAAQACGIKVNERFLGTGGQAGFYSFGRGKNLSLVGGGLLVTDDDNLAEKVAALIEHEFAHAGSPAGEFLKAVSYNFVTRPFVFNFVSRLPGMRLGRSEYYPDFAIAKMSDYKIKLMHRIFRTTEATNANRSKVSQKYMSLLNGNGSISIPKSRLDNQPGSLRFPVLVEDEDKRTRVLAGDLRKGWGLSAMYPTALNRIADLPHQTENRLKGSEYIARSLVTLPTHRHIISGGSNQLIEKIAGLFA